MTTKMRHRLADEYLATLDVALRELPAGRRREVLDDVTEHLDAALAEAAVGGRVSSVAVRRILERLGDPDDIAGEARDDVELPPSSRSFGTEQLTIALLVVPFFLPGWIVGAILLWGSPVWRREEKVLGTLLFPGGLFFAVPLWLLSNTVLSLVGFPVHLDFRGALVLCLTGSVYTAVRLTLRLREVRGTAV